MGVFTDVEMVWARKTYTIKSTRVMGLIAQIEDVITFPEIANFMRRQTVPMARLCQGYAAALKYAGARVTPDDILAAVYDDPGKQMVVLKAVAGLLTMPLPAAQRAEFERALAAAEAGSEDDADGEAVGDAPTVDVDAGNSPAAGAAS
jgi:hypothetical protein